MAVKLREILLLESCRTWIISDRPYCYLYGVDFFDTHLMDERVLVKYSEYHNLDFLILCGYEENRQINKDFQVYMRDGRKVLQENTKFYPVQGLKELGEVLLSNMGIKQDNRWDRREI